MRAAFQAVSRELEESALAMALAVIAGQLRSAVSRSQLAALTLLMSVPVVVLFIVLQRYLLDRFALRTGDSG